MAHQDFSVATSNDYEILNREVVYEGVFRMVRYHLKYRLFDGGFSPTFSAERMERKPAAGVLPYDPIQDKVMLIQQFRVGVIDHPYSPWLYEIVAGIIDQGENAEQVSLREAKEEANCEVLDLYPICNYFVSPGGSNEFFTLYCGKINAAFQEGIFGLAHEHENIKAISLPLDEAFSLLKAGKIKTSPAIISLQWLHLNHSWLKELWLKK